MEKTNITGTIVFDYKVWDLIEQRIKSVECCTTEEARLAEANIAKGYIQMARILDLITEARDVEYHEKLSIALAGRKLKKCPCCGSISIEPHEATYITKGTSMKNFFGWYIKCNTCGLHTTTHPYLETVTALWNQRVKDDE